MTEQQQKLQRIVQARKSLMLKEWVRADCSFAFKTFVEVTFSNSDSDFREQRYPCIEDALNDQQRKLGRDIIRRVGKENMDEVLEVLVG